MAGGDVGALDGKGALVTGGSRGIGRAIVKRLAADGAAVVFSHLQNEAAAREVVREVTEDGGRDRSSSSSTRAACCATAAGSSPSPP
jgi:NAD(P)-dependent dehydrogenase (short-subunit alcohol dehydrogenase family)